MCSQYGTDEGENWALDPGGSVGLSGEPALYEVLNAYNNEEKNHDWQDVGICVANESYRLGQAVDADVDPYAPEGLEKLQYDASADLYEPYTYNTDIVNLSDLKVTNDKTAFVATARVEVEKYLGVQQVAFITGTVDIDDDSAWVSYLEGVNNAGLPELLEVYQIAYDRANGGESRIS